MNTTTALQTRERESFAHVCEITKPFGALDRVIEWCRTECIGEWRWRIVHPSEDIRPGLYIFCFDSERDCLAFIMKWK